MNKQKTFDRVKQTTLETLNKPSVVEVLGDKAVLYSQMIQGAFLPDYYNGSIQLPPDQLFEDNIAIVPFKQNEGTIPNANNFLQWPRYADYAQSIEDKNLDFFNHYRHTQLTETIKRTGLKNAVGTVIAGFKDKYTPNYSYIDRPIIFISSIVNKEPDELVAADIIHELCHVDYATQNFGDKEIITKNSLPHPEVAVDVAFQEKLAYAVGYRVLKVCGIDTVEIAKNSIKEVIENCSGENTRDCIEDYWKYIKGRIDRHDRVMCKKPFFKNIPTEAKSVAINEVFGLSNQSITDEEIAAYASVGIIRARHRPNLKH